MLLNYFRTMLHKNRDYNCSNKILDEEDEEDEEEDEDKESESERYSGVVRLLDGIGNVILGLQNASCHIVSIIYSPVKRVYEVFDSAISWALPHLPTKFDSRKRAEMWAYSSRRSRRGRRRGYEEYDGDYERNLLRRTMNYTKKIKCRYAHTKQNHVSKYDIYIY